LQRIDLGGQDKVVFRQTFYGMSPKFDFNYIIENMDVGMVAFLLGYNGHFIDEFHGFFEVAKFELLLDFLAIHCFPALFYLRKIGFYFSRIKRRRSALASNTFFVG